MFVRVCIYIYIYMHTHRRIHAYMIGYLHLGQGPGRHVRGRTPEGAGARENKKGGINKAGNDETKT